MKKRVYIIFFITLCLIGCTQKEKTELPKKEKAQKESIEQIVSNNCLTCHGTDKVGPAFADIGSRLTEKEIQSIIKNGKGAMPPFSDSFEPETVKQIAAYVVSQSNNYSPKTNTPPEKRTPLTGKDIVQQTCTACHGEQLEGGVGPNIQHATETYSNEELMRILINGKGTMPGEIVNEEEAQEIITYLKLVHEETKNQERKK